MLSWPHRGRRGRRPGSFLAGKRRPRAPAMPRLPAPPKDWFVGFCNFPGKGCLSGQPAACWGLIQHGQRQHGWVPSLRGSRPQPPSLSTPPTPFPTQGPEAGQSWEKSSRGLGPTLLFSKRRHRGTERGSILPRSQCKSGAELELKKVTSLTS